VKDVRINRNESIAMNSGRILGRIVCLSVMFVGSLVKAAEVDSKTSTADAATEDLDMSAMLRSVGCEDRVHYIYQTDKPTVTDQYHIIMVMPGKDGVQTERVLGVAVPVGVGAVYLATITKSFRSPPIPMLKGKKARIAERYHGMYSHYLPHSQKLVWLSLSLLCVYGVVTTLCYCICNQRSPISIIYSTPWRLGILACGGLPWLLYYGDEWAKKTIPPRIKKTIAPQEAESFGVGQLTETEQKQIRSALGVRDNTALVCRVNKILVSKLTGNDGLLHRLTAPRICITGGLERDAELPEHFSFKDASKDIDDQWFAGHQQPYYAPIHIRVSCSFASYNLGVERMLAMFLKKYAPGSWEKRRPLRRKALRCADNLNFYGKRPPSRALYLCKS